MKIMLAEIRESKKITLRQLEELSGVSRSHINEIENGTSSLTVDVLCKLAKALGVPPCDLFDCE